MRSLRRTPKVYAVGARVAEMPIKRPGHDGLKDGGKARWVIRDQEWATIGLPPTRKARRKMFRRLEYCYIPGYAPICVDSNDPDTIACAFKKRLFRDTPRPDPTFLARFALYVRAWVKKLPASVNLSFEEWLGRTSYNEARKQQLRDAWQALRGGRPTKRQASHIDTFVKGEAYPEYKHGRLINSRSDAFKAFSGPLFKAVEDVIYALPQFIKHVPVPDRAAAIRALRKAGRRYYQTDFTAFESHFTPEVMRACECLVYKHLMRDRPEDAAFINAVLTGINRMRTRSGCRAHTRGQRMSGDMCTSCGNGITNWLLAEFLCAEQGHKLFGFVEGDDGLFATEAVLRKEDYARLGFTIEIKEVRDPCEASFCGMVFADSGQIIRDPREFMSKFGWTQSFIHGRRRIMQELLRGKALSCCYETGQCPVVGAIARYALRQTRGVRPRFVDDGYHVPPDEFVLETYNPSADTRQLFSQLYGVSVQSQVAAERAAMRGDFQMVGRLIPPSFAYAHYAARFVESA